MPDAIKSDEDGQAFYGILNGKLATTSGQLSADEVADISLKIIDVVKAHLIVGVWANEVAQNNMRNAIDDYFFDDVRDVKGIDLPVEMLDALEQQIMDLARARFPA